MPRINHNSTDPKQIATQNRQILMYGKTICRCGSVMDLENDSYKCLYCKEWFCTLCAEEHFGCTTEQWSKLLLEPAKKARQTVDTHMNILNESVEIRRRFHDFQRFTQKSEDISMGAFLEKELPEWEELCDETKNKIIKAYRCIIGISSLPLPIKTES